MKHIARFSFFLSTLLLVLCIGAGYDTLSAADEKPAAKFKGSLNNGTWMKNLTVPYSGPEGNFSVQAQIYFPVGYSSSEKIRTLILLPNYGKGMTEWEKLSAVKRYANERGYILVCPDMGKTVYENDYFPETTITWHELPGGRWISAALIPWLRETFAICLTRENTGIAGVGMGARGAMLAAAKNPEIFGFAGGISGLYDASSISRNTTFVSMYGPYKEFKERWETVDNIITIAGNLADTCIYMGHGKRERGSPIELSQIVLIKLAQLRKQAPGKFQYKFTVHDWGDDWQLWNKFLEEMFVQFDECGIKK
jgi:S-formylglutathione hydrolase FrmB